jgi:arsenite transporter
MTQPQLERGQVWLYLLAILAGLGLGGVRPDLSAALDRWLWPVLALLLYATFTQVPLLRLQRALRDARFTAAALIGNFLLVPLLVWGLVQLLPQVTPLRLGVFLVLLVPCTDWYITFARLGRADAALAVALTPLNLIVQMLLLPLYLWLFLGEEVALAVDARAVGGAFVVIVLLPLLAAIGTQLALARRRSGRVLQARLGWWPVPLLAIVVFMVAASQVQVVAGALFELTQVLLVFIGYLLIVPLLARFLAGRFGLGCEAGRALAFSMGSRNSFVVLPLALALPAGWELVAVVIVLQSLVELFGMTFYLWWIPEKLFRQP